MGGLLHRVDSFSDVVLVAYPSDMMKEVFQVRTVKVIQVFESPLVEPYSENICEDELIRTDGLTSLNHHGIVSFDDFNLLLNSNVIGQIARLQTFTFPSRKTPSMAGSEVISEQLLTHQSRTLGLDKS